MSQVNWEDVVYYDETSPSCLRWACNIPYRGTFGDKVSYKRVVGDIAGTIQRSNNRFKLKYQQKAYMAHRVIYELFYGPIDKKLVIDHIDGDGTNNRIENLRLVTQGHNARNTKKRGSNKTGVNGVTEMEITSKYDITYKYYSANWFIDGKNFNKYFSVVKLGNEEAFRLACEYRAKMIEELNAQGAGYTERHGT